MHTYVMSRHLENGEKPWIWGELEFNLIFSRVIDALREIQERAPREARASCIEWLSFTMESRFYRFRLGDYDATTIRDIRQAVVDHRDEMMNDPELTDHPNRDYATKRITSAIDDLLALIDNHLSRSEADRGS